MAWRPPRRQPGVRAAVMGVLNVTPDSFSDGGALYGPRGLDQAALLERAEAMVAAGADILDVGGESTRPGARPVPREEELARVVPALRLLRRHFAVPLSVDTSDPEVMRAAAGEGADLINDVRALRRPGALQAAAASGLAVCLMHMPAEPPEMQRNPQYGDVVAEVERFLQARVEQAVEAGISPERILVDPGFGFGKTLEHNLALLRALPRLRSLGRPLLVGVSRKRMVGELTGREVAERLAGSLALALLAVERGADVVRVHDVAETVDALTVLARVEAVP
ncbi:MAG: dihydropteroate synthase [Porticoccaceae bacterium]|nr:MAG: dihydropteroate synthase [Porticoccaceae bacterium]